MTGCVQSYLPRSLVITEKNMYSDVSVYYWSSCRKQESSVDQKLCGTPVSQKLRQAWVGRGAHGASLGKVGLVPVVKLHLEQLEWPVPARPPPACQCSCWGVHSRGLCPKPEQSEDLFGPESQGHALRNLVTHLKWEEDQLPSHPTGGAPSQWLSCGQNHSSRTSRGSQSRGEQENKNIQAFEEKPHYEREASNLTNQRPKTQGNRLKKANKQKEDFKVV